MEGQDCYRLREHSEEHVWPEDESLWPQILEIKAGMAIFASVEVVYESRNSNGDAHRLAKSLIYGSVGRHVRLFFPTNGVCTDYFDI